MKIRNLIIAMLVGLSFFPRGAINDSPSKEAIKITLKQQNSNTSSQISDSSEISTTINNSSFISSNEVVSESSKTILSEEEIEEIVKQVSNAIIGEELTDKLFGVFGLGIVVIIGLYVVFQVNERMKNKKVQNELTNTTNSLSSKLKQEMDVIVNTYEDIKDKMKIDEDNYQSTISKLNDEYQQKITSLVNAYDEKLAEILKAYDSLLKENSEKQVRNDQLVKAYERETRNVIESNSKLTYSLQSYSLIDKKINAIIESIKEISSTSENVKQGVTEKVNDIFKEVK